MQFPSCSLVFHVTASWKNWVAYGLSDRAVRDMKVAAGILPLLIASTCFEIYKDIVGLRFVARTWSTRTHTFISAAREFTPTLADVLRIFQLPIGGDNEDPLDAFLDNKEQEKEKEKNFE